MRAFASLALTTAVLAACGPAETPAPAAPQPEAPVATAPVDYKRVSVDGVGPINAQTPFDRDAVAALFPDATQVKAAFLLDGPAMEAASLTVWGPNERMIELQGAPDGKIGTVLVTGGDLNGPRGERLGQGWGDVGFVPSDCTPGQGRFLHNPVCRRAAQPNLAYVFAVRRWTRDEVPDPTTLTARGTLSAIIWTRP